MIYSSVEYDQSQAPAFGADPCTARRRAVQVGTRYKRWNESYNYDYVNWSEDFDRGDPEAAAVYEQYKVWLVTQRLKA